MKHAIVTLLSLVAAAETDGDAENGDYFTSAGHIEFAPAGLKQDFITGSDSAAYPPMSDLLGSLGVPILEPYGESNLDPAPDLVVVGGRGGGEARV